MAIPAAPTDEIYPVYTDLVDNWRAVDVHWLRNRVVQIFDDAAERASVVTAPFQGQLSYLKTTKSVEFYQTTTTPNGWESIRYPNLVVTSDATTVTMRQTAAGAGLTYKSDGSVVVGSVLQVAQPAGAGGVQLDATGLTIKVGTKSVKLATDATQLTVDSPVKVTGDIEATAALKGATAAITGALTAASSTLSGALASASINCSGTINGGLLNIGNAEVAVDTGLAVFRHKNSAANRLSYDNTGAAILTGATVQITGALTINSAAVMMQNMDFRVAPTLHYSGTTAVPVAGVVVYSFAPTTETYPNGTIWLQI